MNNAFIELDRLFAKYQTNESPESLAQRSYMASVLGHEQGMAWNDLLQHRLVVVLGEPGSGKTEELKAQHAQSTCSFFLELNRLVREEMSGILDDNENLRFAKWKNGSGEATFFLDAVDESKIVRNDDFFTALERMKKAVGSAMVRARFVISSRISEWHSEMDQAGVLQRLGIDRAVNNVEETEGGKRHFDRNLPRNTETRQKGEETKESPVILVVTLVPLTPSQVERYASTKGMNNPQQFIAALEENNARAFAGRPLDVDFLCAYWSDKGHLGNLTDLSEYMIAKLLAEVPNRKNQDVLSPEQAREGAEFLAAAVVFSRRLKFRVSDASGIAEGNLLSPAVVLPGTWRPKECQAMMDRALFDAASHGAMSFHHRYHSDFLAAAWVARMMAHNCGIAALEDLLFAKVNGEWVMRPSLKPIAAWLITAGDEPWRCTLAEWILGACPEIHLVHGDPDALPLEYRRKILGELVKRYQGRQQVHLSMDHAALARFADTELAEEINRYLLDKAISEDLRADLLMVVRAGKITACMPIALEIFADSTTTDSLRSYVATLIRDAGELSHRKQLAELWQDLPDISNLLLARLCEALFPHVIDVNGFLALVRRSEEVPRHSIDLPYYLGTLLKENLSPFHARALLVGILDLLLTPPLMNGPELSKKFYWLTGLIPLCLQRLLVAQDLNHEAQDLVISAIFMLEKVERAGDSYRSISADENKPSIQQLLSLHGELRRKLFWERIAKYRSMHGREPARFEIGGYGAVVELVPDDLDWLLADVQSNLPFLDRHLALEVAADMLWTVRMSLFRSVWKLWPCARGNPALVAVCRHYAWTRLRAPLMGVWFRHFRPNGHCSCCHP